MRACGRAGGGETRPRGACELPIDRPGLWDREGARVRAWSGSGRVRTRVLRGVPREIVYMLRDLVMCTESVSDRA